MPELKRFADPDEDVETELLLSAPDLATSGGVEIFRIDADEITDELIDYLGSHPEKMREIKPRTFEKLVAEMFVRKGSK